MSAATVFMKSPHSDETVEVEATTEKLTPWMAAGYQQVPAPASHDTATLASAKEGE